MKQNNIIGVPVSTKEYVTGTIHGYTDETTCEFTQIATGDIKIQRTLSQRSDRPTENWTDYSGPATTDYTNYKVTQVFKYDASGNLVTANDEGGRSVANIYDYNDKYIVASVVNADATPDKLAYTSFETPSRGGWRLAATASYDPNAVTGNWSLNLAGNSCSADLNTAKAYILSFWANSGNVSVAGGATLVKSAPLINGFTYYEYNIAAGTSTVTLTGNALIDELRIYPNTSRMRTVTFDPLIGKTSECDENNRCIYYEYDNLGRLRFVKDENRNIVKMYEFNNVSKQSGCPAIYYNQTITEYFNRTDCGSNTVPSDEPYTVPANKYSSTISQEDADAKAQHEALVQGQKNADQNGSCKPLYPNGVQWQDFQTQSCDDGYKPGTVRYTVDAGKYTSPVPGEADQMALDDIKANGQAYANSKAHRACTLDTDPEWQMVDNGASYCANVNGQTPAHLFKQAIDVNPNSQSYNQPSFQDAGPSDQCPFAWYSTDQSGNYYNQNCASGSAGSAYYVSIPQSAYSSNVSLDDANNQARAYGQSQANASGQCVVVGILIYSDNNHGADVTIQLHNNTSGQTYTFTAQAHNSNTANVPAGNYNITLIPGASGYYFYTVGCGYSDDGPGQVTFLGIDLNSDCNTIEIN